MLYAPLAVERLVAAVFVRPAYAVKPTRRERVSRRGPSGAGERAAQALTQERAQRTLRRLPAGRTAAASRRPGERSPSCVHPRGLPGHGKPSTASRSAAHSPASKKPIEQQPAAVWQGSGGAEPPGYAPAHANSTRHARAPFPLHAYCLLPTSADWQDRPSHSGAVAEQRTTMSWQAPMWTRPAPGGACEERAHVCAAILARAQAPV